MTPFEAAVLAHLRVIADELRAMRQHHYAR